MWNRSRLKENAKMSLGSGIFKPRWLMALLVVFIVSIIGGNGGNLLSFSPSVNFNYNTTYNLNDGDLDDLFNDYYYDDYYDYDDDYYYDDYYDYYDDYYDYGDDLDDFFDSDLGRVLGVTTIAALGVFVVIALISLAISAVYSIFVGNIIHVGMSRYFLANRDLSRNDAPSLGLLFSGFKKGQYGNIAKAMAWRMLFLFLWALIPIMGWIMVIIKTYAYFLVPYIMADNPNINYKKALQMSKEMTDGHKWNMFVLELSFLGWQLLGLLACCVGVLFVIPYQYATYAELYDVLKKTSISNGKYPPEDFSMDRQGLNLNVPYIFNPYYTQVQYNAQPQYNQYNQYNQQQGQYNPNAQYNPQSQYNPNAGQYNPQPSQYDSQPQYNPQPNHYEPNPQSQNIQADSNGQDNIQNQ